MLTIYLDQAQWIELSRARHGRADGARFAGALDAFISLLSGMSPGPSLPVTGGDHRVSAVTEIHENIGWALERAGLPSDALGPIGLAEPDLPEEQVRDVLAELLPLARASSLRSNGPMRAQGFAVAARHISHINAH